MYEYYVVFLSGHTQPNFGTLLIVADIINMGLNESTRLYDPFFEHDSCGVGFVANINGAMYPTRSSTMEWTMSAETWNTGAPSAET